jgi:hypothetical protein
MRCTLSLMKWVLFVLLLPVTVWAYSLEVNLGRPADAALLGATEAARDGGAPERWVEFRVLPPGVRVTGYEVICEDWVAAQGHPGKASAAPDAFSSEEGTAAGDAGGLLYVGSGSLFGYNLLAVAAERRRAGEDGPEELESMRLRVDLEGGDAGLTVTRRSVLTDRFLKKALHEALGIDVSSGASYKVTGASDCISEAPSLDGSAVDCVIVTSDSLASEFERLAAWHGLMGVRTAVRTVAWIESRYPGSDTPERIRNFLKDAYTNWGTIYALMGGDPVVVPMRVLEYGWLWNFTAETADEIAVDCYYSNLDGDWNADGDGLFGEGGSFSDDDAIDPFADILVGRAPVESAEDARTFVDKTILYARGGKKDGWQDRTVFMAQVIEEQTGFDGAEFAELILEHFPGDFETTRLYQNYTAYDGAVHETLENCMNYLNAGAGIVSHIGHGDFFRLNLGGQMMWRWQADALSNDSTFFFMYMMNCASASPGVESIAKNFIRNPGGGAVALVGNQIFAAPRNGLALEEKVFELLFASEGLTLGAVTTIPRNLYALPTRNYPWWTYVNNILYGDPCLMLWKATPGNLSVAGSSSMGLGDSVYTVTVEASGAGVEGAVVVLSGSLGEYGSALTDASGQAAVRFRPRGPGTVARVVSREGYVPAEGSISVSGSGGRPYVSSVVIDDEDGGSFAGNGDGEAGWGERVNLEVGLVNGGPAALNGVSASLSPVAGCSLQVDVEFPGAAGDIPVYIGGACTAPAGMPFGLGAGRVALGRCTRDLGEQKGCWLWLDSRGWHVRFNGRGEEGFAYRCSLEVYGEVAGVGGVGLEPGDEAVEGDGYLLLAGDLDENDFEDGLDFASGYASGVTVHDGEADYGSVGTSEVVRGFDVEFSGGPGDGMPVWFEVEITDASAGRWYDWLPVTVGDGRPEIEMFSGFGGFPYDFTIGLRNTGKGGLKGLRGTVRGLSGISIVDSVSEYGDLAGGEYAAGDGFRYSGALSSPLIEVEIADAFGRVWLDSVYERSVLAPGDVTYSVGPDFVDLRWEASADPGLSHYEIYRSGQASAGVLVGTARGNSRFVDTGLESERNYYYTVMARDFMGNGSQSTEETEIWTGAPCMSGFPAEIRGAAWSSPVSGDADQDGLKEIFVGSRGQDLAALDMNGDALYGFPYICTCEVRSSPVLVDLDGDGDLECVFGIGMDVVGGAQCAQVVALNHDGTAVNPANNPGLPSGAPGWPRTVGALVRSAPAVYDLDLDGHPEVLIGAMGKVDGYGPLYAFRYDGSPYLSGGPVFGRCDNVIWTSPCVADLDDDGRPEVIVADLSGGLYVWKWDGGAYLADSTGLLVDTDAAFWASPAVGDVDGDGRPEIVAVNDWGQVYVFNHDGSPAGVSGGQVAALGGTCWSDPALADFDGDGALEIAFGLGPSPGRLVLLRGDGSAYGSSEFIFTAMHSLGYSSPAIADIDGDGELEIVACSVDARIYGLNPDGTSARGFPRRIDGQIYSSPLIDDLDRDGDMDLVIAGYDARVHVWDLKAPYSEDAVPWGMYHHDIYNTGYAGFEAPRDTLPPRCLIGVFQGTVVDRALDIYVASSEYTESVPVVEVASGSGRETLTVVAVPSTVRTYRAHYVTSAASAETIYVHSTDLSGNSGTEERVITYSRLVGGEMVATSSDGLLEVRSPLGSSPAVTGILPVDAAYLCVPADQGPVSGAAYNVCRFGGTGAGFMLSALAGPDEALYIFDGTWVQVDGQVRDEGRVTLADARAGIYAVGLRSASVAPEFGLSPGGPNPFAAECRFALAGDPEKHVNVSVFDVRGRLVSRVYEGRLGSSGEIVWDGRDREGRRVSSGIYFVRAETSSAAVSRKVVYVR